jgi:hypothetical protein
MSRPTTAVVQIVEGDDRDKNMLMICKAARFYSNHYCDSRPVNAGTIIIIPDKSKYTDDIGIELPRYHVISGEESEGRENGIYMYLCISDKEQVAHQQLVSQHLLPRILLYSSRKVINIAQTP